MEMSTTPTTPTAPPKKKPKTEPSFVWFALWRGNDFIVEADEVPAKGLTDISDLRRAVKDKCPYSLKGIPAAALKVYEPQTVKGQEVRLRKEQFGKELDVGDNIPDTPDDGMLPMLVVAPKKVTPNLTNSHGIVWVQLYYKGENEPKGLPVEIEPLPRNVGALAAVVLPKLDPTELAETFVYPPGTKPPFPEQTSMRRDKKLNELIDEMRNTNPPGSIDYDHPLIVVAPKQETPASTNNHGIDTHNANEPPPKKVWFALWRDGKLVVDELEARGMRDIADLRKAVHNQLRNRLQDLDAADLTVYEPQAVEGEEVRLRKEQFGVKLHVGDKIPDTADDGMVPILVVAPKKITQADQPSGDAIQAKRRKDFSKLSPPEVVKELRDIAAPLIGSDKEDPKEYRWPCSFSVDTWDREWVQKELCAKRELVHERLKTYTRHDRQSVVLGMRLGSGFGKTHLLTEAPSLLGAQGLYVSYNMTPHLKQDRESPVQAFFVRLMLSACGCSQRNCGEFIRSENFKYFRHLPQDFLRNCFLELAKKTFQWGEIVIGLDEVMLLGTVPILTIISELAELSHVYTTTDPKSRCTCIVSSLQDKAFATRSGRSVEHWNPKHPDHTTYEHFARTITSMRKEESMALANAVCGNHMRSIVIAFDEIRKGTTPTVQSLLSGISERLGNYITVGELAEFVKYVKDCIQFDPAPSPPDAVEPYVGEDMALPPVIMTKAFERKAGAVQLRGLLNSFSVFDGGAGKQLENIGKCYDLFRAAMRLPVVPAAATIRGNSPRPEEWYGKLIFDEVTEESNEDLLKMQNVTGRLEVVPTGIIPEWGKYYHPGSANHPWLDRLVVGRHKDDGSKCMIIYQDKVNRTDFASACGNLNRAADLLSPATRIDDVLLIVNVVGATTQTRAQANLKWPYILVRDSEIREFYSRNFASMVEFARKRHELSLTG